MEITWIAHACFQLKTNSGKIIYFDPYKIPKDAEKADILIISHSHGDHMDGRSIKNVLKDSTIVIGPESESYSINQYANGKSLKIGEILDLGEIKIQLVPAYTIKKSTHPKSSGWAGSIVEVEGKRIYHAGDTERIPEMGMDDISNIDVAILPCGGTYTMDMDEASDAACDIDPEIVIPMHNWGKDLNDFKEMLSKKNPEIKVEILTGKILSI
jgi:L-ascorbate metabolism protein UlaG (beta-lactamase superfamily)